MNIVKQGLTFLVEFSQQKYMVEWNTFLKFMFDFCSMIIKVFFFFLEKLFEDFINFLESLSYSFDIQTDLFKVFMVSSCWLFSSLQLLTALTLPNTHSSNPLHMKQQFLNLDLIDFMKSCLLSL